MFRDTFPLPSNFDGLTHRIISGLPALARGVGLTTKLFQANVVSRSELL